MKHWSVMLLIGITGCSSPSFVGTWRAQPLQSNGESTTFNLRADGSLTGQNIGTEAGDLPFAGQWKQSSHDTATVTINGQSETAHLVNDDQMTLTDSRPAAKPTTLERVH